MIYSEDYWDDISRAVGSISNVSSLYNKSILITGATGLVCSSVVDLLLFLNKSKNANIKIIVAGRSRQNVLHRFGASLVEGKITFVSYDATSTEFISLESNIDYLIHGASNATPAAFVTQPVETILANVLGLHVILHSAVKASAARVLYVSSSEVYGSKEDDSPYLETDYGAIDILNQRAAYPLSKRSGESLCIAYGLQHNLDTVIARPGHIYGPVIQRSDNRASAQFARKAKKGEDIVMKSRGGQLRSYCHSFDCASAMLTILLTGKRDNAYNISNPKSICSISELAQAIAEEAGVEVAYEAASDSERISYNLMSNSSLSSLKLEKLGWKPVFDLESGVRNMLCQFHE